MKAPRPDGEFPNTSFTSHPDASMIYLWILASYVLGSLPFGIIIARTCKGIDPRTAGSGNPGATNVARLCGLPWGILTLACDLLKGLLAVQISLYLSPDAWFHSACVLAVIGGHIKSCFLGFRGGKGVSTTIGALIPLGLPPLLCAAGCCVAVIAVSSFVSLGSLTLVSSLLIFYPLFDRFDLLPLAVVLTVLIFWTHRSNIGRLLRGEEKSWRKSRN